MILIAILLATLAAGIGSVWLAAAVLRLQLGGRWNVSAQHLLSLAAGALLATAFMHLLPEAFESGAEPHDLFAVLLMGLVFFFVLEKAELWHHGHENTQGPEAQHLNDPHGHQHGHHHGHHHGHGHAGDGPRPSGWALLTGDSVHSFGDGVLIASAFVADWRLGLVAALSVLAHEVPHHIGDLVVLRHAMGSRKLALTKVSLAGSATALGGMAGYGLVQGWSAALPYFLVVASSSFIYVALADLIPQLQKRLTALQTVVQIGWLIAGAAAVVIVSSLVHG
ncbi:ZIP family metal transporter [Comamonas faecalis]|uniref:ZIP family metal transporter n=1 Tax=Comamonas faecalis TaxID=1387849 RepID=A0ABP7R364_9BURK